MLGLAAGLRPPQLLRAEVRPYYPSTSGAQAPGRGARVVHADNNSQGPDWAACVKRVADRRCRDSFMQLFNHFAPRIGTYLRQQGLPAEQAEELSQEAMLSLWRKAQLFDPAKASVSTWLFRIARNLMLDQLRRERSQAYDDEEALAGLSVEDSAPAAADAQMLVRSLAHLPAPQRQLVFQNYYEGKSHAQIAAETGQPLGSVKSGLRLALQKLRRQLDAEVARA